MPTLFDKIVLCRPKKDNKPDMRPLWKLKLSDLEFEELRNFLLIGIRNKNPEWFNTYPRECLLFFAEYWKRCFDGGAHSKHAVVDCLETGLDIEYEKALYKAARRGADILKIDIFQNVNRSYFDSILYQGGLPMCLICQPDREGFQNWTTFAKRLVRGYIDLSEENLGLGLAATELDCIRQFAEQLSLAVATENPETMPFDCPDRNHPWFKALMNLKRCVQGRDRESNPFSILWQIELDDHNRKGRILGRVQIPAKLSPIFLDEQKVLESVYTTARVMTDGVIRASVEYQNGYARMSRDLFIPMVSSETVLSIDFEDRIVATGSFDYLRPHLFTFNGRQSNGMIRGEKANRIKDADMLLLIPKDWTLEQAENMDIISYGFNDFNVSIVHIPAGFSRDVRLVDYFGNRIVFNADPIGETQLIYKPLCADLVLSPTLCDASKIQKCHILTEKDEGIIRQCRSVEFECRETREWSSTPGFGKIKARGIGTANDISEPVTLCNVGSDFRIDIVRADADTAALHIKWPHGNVKCLEAGSVYTPEEDTWMVRKENLVNPAVVSFRLTVSGRTAHSFLLRLRAPFRRIGITDECGLSVTGNVYVPFCDYEKFSYGIFGYDSARLNIGSDKYRLNEDGKKLRLSAVSDLSHDRPKRINRYGSIATLFGSSGRIRQLLDKQIGTIATSDVKVGLGISNTNDSYINLNIRENPFRISWDAGKNELILRDPDGVRRDFRHSLLAFILTDPQADPVEISADEDGIMRMPKELLTEKNILIAGKVPGRVLPTLLNKSGMRLAPWKIINLIGDDLCKSSIGSEVWIDCLDWFDRAAEYGIPYSSLHQLSAIGLSQETLIWFAFQCMLNFESAGKEDLIDRLLQFSRDLCFKWFWLIPALHKGLLRIIEPGINLREEGFVRMIVPQAITTLPMEYLQVIVPEMIVPKMTEFQSFLEGLIEKSLADTQRHLSKDMLEVAKCWISNKGDFVGAHLENAYDWFPDLTSFLGDDIKDFCNFNIRNKPVNENWLCSRAHAFAAHMVSGQPDLFSMRRNARRSLCLCYDVAPATFIKEAHNKMIDNKHN